MTAENNPTEVKRKDPPGVLCAKCDHLNPPGSTECDHCHARLFRVCSKCGQSYQDALSRCPHCGTRPGRLSRRKGNIHPAAQSFNMWWVYAVALLFALAVCYKVFQKVGNLNFGQ